MEVFLQFRLQIGFDHRLRDSVRDRWNTSRPSSDPSSLGDLHALHWWRKVAARRHAIPELVEIVFQISLKLLNRLIIDTSCSPVRFHPFVRIPNPSFGNTPRLRLIQKDPPVSG